ncbi:hypothetical protein [Kitasatospora griseola]
MSRLSRTVIIAVLAGVAFGVTTAIGNLPVDLVATAHGFRFAVVRGLLVGVLHGSPPTRSSGSSTGTPPPHR